MNNVKHCSYFAFEPEKIFELDTAVIKTHFEAAMIENLASRLFEYSESGTVVPILASDFYWNDKTLTILLNTNFKTSKGNLITTRDVYVSLLRNLVLDSGTHGKLKDILCPNLQKLSSMTETCSNLKYDSNAIYLTAEDDYKNSLIEILTSRELSIIPESKIDLNTLRIKDWTETTGAYFVDSSILKDDNKTWVIFKKNIFSKKTTDKNPDVVLITRPEKLAQLDALKNGIVDVIPTEASLDLAALQMLNDNNQFNIYKTHGMDLNFLQFSKFAFDHTNIERRLIFAQAFKEFMIEHMGNESIYTPTIEYFPSFSNMSLNSNQKEMIEQQILNIDRNEVVNEKGVGFSFGMYSGFSQGFKEKVKKRFPKLKIIESDNISNVDDNLSKMHVDAIVGFVDTFVSADYQAINFMVESRKLFVDIRDGEIFMRKFLNTSDKANKIEMMKDAHFKMLHDIAIFPITFASYCAIATKKWQFKMSGIFAGTPFWLIEHE